MQTEGPGLWDSLLLNTLSFFVIPVERGATTQVWLASGEGGDKDAIGGEYFIRCKPSKVTSAGNDMDVARKLWGVSETMTGEKFEL
jgi:hypothetical protein